jgi:prepilin-type N-terminal cleavage/methylation domain-containing protein
MNPVIKPINSKYGFTITELLVVIVIILVLAVVLVPTITKLKDRAAATGCASNMRQCIALSLMFTTEQNGRMPRLHVDWNRIESEVGRPLLPVNERTVTNKNAVFWPDLISTYAEAGSTFSCPKLKMNATDGNGGGQAPTPRSGSESTGLPWRLVTKMQMASSNGSVFLPSRIRVASYGSQMRLAAREGRI